ncbi:hypothetical protein HPB47_019868 [Ixodes persulcatus]|uniref:Uncharacterized protein n=1 Tax=Ixodes persulcatus TaxID=34615 RepID=A0AC60QGY3_IXOPE|nr:hypothetical protein HPB47_019868 [Ixodes persulcatus]
MVALNEQLLPRRQEPFGLGVRNVKNITKLNETELKLGINEKTSWHKKYKDSAWIFVGGLDYELTEGDIICVFSQFGEIVNINLIRDKKTGKSKGYCFLCFEDQRSTVLSVDNLNGISLCQRTLRVDHVENYRPPKDSDDLDALMARLHRDGCAPEVRRAEESAGVEEEGRRSGPEQADDPEYARRLKKESGSATDGGTPARPQSPNGTPAPANGLARPPITGIQSRLVKLAMSGFPLSPPRPRSQSPKRRTPPAGYRSPSFQRAGRLLEP